MRAPALRGGHRLELLERGEAFFPALERAMAAAEREIRLETYIFHADASGERVLNALEQAAGRGVAVYLVVDGVGTGTLPVPWQQRLDTAGVQHRVFAPLGRWGLLLPTGWRRLHRKLCVVDECLAFCGGINILDDHMDPQYGAQDRARFDFSVQVHGPLVADVHAAMQQLWQRLQWKQGLKQPSLLRRSWRRLFPSSRACAPPQDAGSAQAMLLLRDNVRHRNRIEKAYRKAIGDARQDILIANAYFLPGGKLRRALMHAARRGVRVRLLLQGRYEYFMQYHGARPVFGALLDAGVEIYEYHVGFLHAKVAVVDGHWATVGSSNLDPLSLLLAREANVVIDDDSFSQTLRARLLRAIDVHGVRLDAKSYAARPWHERLLDHVAHGLMRLSLLLTGKRY